MNTQEPEIAQNSFIQETMFKLRLSVAGLARDFWHDGHTVPPMLSFLPMGSAVPKTFQQGDIKVSSKAPIVKKLDTGWKADKIQVLEKLWGAGRIRPGNRTYWVELTAPIGLNQEMSVLDLNAGLGGMARFIADEYGAYVTGMEPDHLFAARGMILSIAAGKSKHASITPYDATVYSASRKYDCVLALELFFSIIGKDQFFEAVDGSLKSGGGQLVFTDFLLDEKDREKTPVKKWMEAEENASPLSSIEMIKQWKGKGYDVRVTEDQTEDYKVFIIKGLAKFVQFIATAKPDHATKLVILAEIEKWATRYMALKDGLKYYRIIAIKR